MFQLLSFLFLLVYYVLQGASFIIPRVIADIECTAETAWMNNAFDQSPCVVVKKLTSDPSCLNEDVVMVPLDSGAHYDPEFLGQRDNACLCNRPIYTLISACGKCQGLDRTFVSWDDFTKNCASVYDGYPAVVPEDTEIPQWAMYNVSERTSFNLAVVSQAAAAAPVVQTVVDTVDVTITVIATDPGTFVTVTQSTSTVTRAGPPASVFSPTATSTGSSTPISNVSSVSTSTSISSQPAATTSKATTTTSPSSSSSSPSQPKTQQTSLSSSSSPSTASNSSVSSISRAFSTSSATSTASTSAGISSTGSSLPIQPTTTSAPEPDGGTSTYEKPKGGLIAGFIVGGISCLSLIAALIVWLIRRRKPKMPSRMSSSSVLGAEHDRTSQVHIIHARRSVGSSFWNRATPFREPELESGPQHEPEALEPPDSPSIYSEVFAFKVPESQPAWRWTKFVEDIPGPSRRYSEWSGAKAF